MKHISFFTIVATFVAAVNSCGVKELDCPSDDYAPGRQDVEIEASNADQYATKTVRKEDGKIYWNPADEINVFFGSDKGKFTSTNTEDALTAKFSGSLLITSVVGMNEGGADDNCLWGLYPYDENASLSNGEVSTTLSDYQFGVAGSFPDDTYITLARNNSFSLAFYNVLSGFRFTVTKTGIISVTFEGNNNEELAGSLKLAFGDNGKPVVNSITNGKTKITLTPENGEFEVGKDYYILFVPTTFSKGFTVKMETDDSEGSFVYKDNISFARNIFSRKRDMDNGVEFKNIDNPRFVDLGLSVKWATCNLGASSPEESGGYYQWAGIKDVTDELNYVSYNNAPYCIWDATLPGQTKATWTKYLPTIGNSFWERYYDVEDGKTILESGDDVVQVKLGGKWRMPTYAEFEELINNCTWMRTTINDVSGYKVTSNVEDYTDKWIFLPFTSSSYDTNLEEVRTGGAYWSSSVGSTWPGYAFSLNISYHSNPLNEGEDYDLKEVLRYKGHSVRPVYGEQVKATSVSPNNSEVSITTQNGAQLSATLEPSNCAEKGLVWSSSDPNVATISKSGTITAISAGSTIITVYWAGDSNIKANCNVIVTDPEAPVPEMVDLGLSVKWASFNLGARNPAQSGRYYQWAGTKDVASTGVYLDFSNCPYHIGSDYNNGWTKYISSNKSSYWSGEGNPDDKINLDLEDDVAHVALGGSWRMPTREEFQELKNNCTYEGTYISGVYGSKFTSDNGNSIFLPAAGYRNKYELQDYREGGFYWSSSSGSAVSAEAFFFISGTINILGWDRYLGFPVRPVSE